MLRAWYRLRASESCQTQNAAFAVNASELRCTGFSAIRYRGEYQNDSKTRYSANLSQIRAKEKRRHKPTLFLLLFCELQKQENRKAEDSKQDFHAVTPSQDSTSSATVKRSEAGTGIFAQ